jgi:alpha-N-acetylglucosamine transferase
MRAWATLLTQPGYLAGVRTLNASLRRSGSAYPLVVMVTDAIDDRSRAVLEDDGCLLRDVESLRPASDIKANYANARFAEVWTKLAAWRLTEFERIVFMDADMLVTQNMDELFALPLDPGAIAACHACRCNPNKIASYPVSWTPVNCAYTYWDADAGGLDGRGLDGRGLKGRGVDAYFNGGLLVLAPDEAVFSELVGTLGAVGDLSRYPFAEQDFLNEYYDQRWTPLPYIYNALKTLPQQHPSMWDGAAVKNIHYIIDKPWEKPLDPADRYFELNRLWWDVAANVRGLLD